MSSRARQNGGSARTRAQRLVRPLDERIFPRQSQATRVLRSWIPPDAASLLDVGCGDDARLLEIVPGLRRTVGVDTKVPDDRSGPGRHDEYREMDIRELAHAFPARSFEIVVALDVIEHLTREDGFRLLDAMEAIASSRVIVFTPNGFLAQPPAPDNPHQEHVSGWDAADLRSRGYTVLGVNGWRPLRGPYAAPRWRPEALWRRASILTEPLVTRRPELAFQLLGRKDVDAA